MRKAFKVEVSKYIQMEATGPRTIQEHVEEMVEEGCRLVKELKLADKHIDGIEEENKKLKLELDDVEGDLAVALAERDQADAEVNKLEKEKLTLIQERDELLEEVQKLKQALQEWEDLEGWRQGRWVLLQEELKKLRKQVASSVPEPTLETLHGC